MTAAEFIAQAKRHERDANRMTRSNPAGAADRREARALRDRADLIHADFARDLAAVLGKLAAEGRPVRLADMTRRRPAKKTAGTR